MGRVTRKAWLPCAVAALLTAGTGWAQWQPRFEVEGRYFMPDDLRASGQVGGVPGTRFDFVRDLGLQEEDVPELRLAWRTSNTSKLRFSYALLDFDERRVIDRPIIFDGQTFAAGTPVTTELDHHFIRLDWVWKPIQLGVFRAGPILGLHGWLADARLQSPGPTSRRETFHSVIPAVGLALDLVPHRTFDIFLEGSGMDQGAKGWHLDVEGGVRVTPVRQLAISAGYRRLDVRTEDNSSTDFARWLLEGPFVGVAVRF